ncbi:helix-turn-helix domain-containing protein [Rhodococcus sp. MSC1_016]|uniref:helix-turn-helix domain-containing protein n=1 Tax=Rhodococcus sp. MSC1_016 TaxID=2909266 RepID=UPI0020307A88|nr:helix-turn-helix domain-containing protein [Rhodococcus sp. MSC1_016]
MKIARVSALATPKEVAVEMRTTEAVLAQKRHKGDGIPFVRDGRKVLYRWSDVDAYIESRLMTRTDDRPDAA